MADLTPSQRKALEKTLAANYRSLLDEMRAQTGTPGEQQRPELLNREPADSGDEAAAASIASLNLTLANRLEQELRDIEAAQARIERGEYGVCIDCGEDIGYSRLQAYPTAKRCIRCQARHEKLYAPSPDA